MVIFLLFITIQVVVIAKCGYLDQKESFINAETKPSEWDVGFDCKIKKLAFDYAKKLSPGTGTDTELNLIFKGLQLGAVCNESFHGQNFHYPWSKADERINPDETAIIFVDQSRGKTNFEGDIVRPMFDIQSGIDHCFSTLQGSKLFRNCIVNIRQGVYQLDKPLKLHSNIKLKSYKNEKVVVSGFKTIIPKWKKFVERTDLFENLNPIFARVSYGMSKK